MKVEIDIWVKLPNGSTKINHETYTEEQLLDAIKKDLYDRRYDEETEFEIEINSVTL